MDNLCKAVRTNIEIIMTVVFICGSLLVFFTPPMAVPDENTHFLNAYSISQGDLFPDYNYETESIGRFYPQYIIDFVEYYNSRFAGNLDVKYTYSEGYFQSWVKVQKESRNSIFYEKDTLGINPWSYFFSSVGIRIGQFFIKIFGLEFDTAYNLLLMCRFSNFLAYFCIGYLAIRITPKMELLLALILVNPTALFCGASASYDAVIIPVTLLYLSELLNILMRDDDKLVTSMDYVIIGFCTLFLTGVKMAYAPFLLLLFFIHPRKFGKTSYYLIAIVFVAVCAILGSLLPSILLNGHTLGVGGGMEMDVIQQQYLLNNWFHLPKIIINSFSEYSEFYLSGFIGKLGQLDTNYPVPILSFFLMGIIIITIFETSDIEKISILIKLSCLGIIIVSLIGMFGFTYIHWTPRVLGTKTEVVSGVQGRYFIPLYPFFALIISRKKLQYSAIGEIAYKVYVKFSFIFLIIECISTPILIIFRYWV